MRQKKKDNALSIDLLAVIELAKSGAYEEALSICKKIRSANINNAKYFNVVGIVCRRLGLLDEAVWNSKKALKLDKGLVAAKMNIANIEFQKGSFKKAIKLLRVIVSEEPSYQEAKANLALAYKNIGEIKKSLNIYRNLEYGGSWSSVAKFNYGITNLSIGTFKEGWKYYEYRWKVSPGNKEIWPFEDKPLWSGEEGKRVALWREQGIGDDIIFLSLVPEAKKMSNSLSVYVDPRLHSLCRRAMPKINFVNDLYWGGDFKKSIETINKMNIDNPSIKFFSGYSGWTYDQLIDEINNGSWVVKKNRANTLFKKDIKKMWGENIKKIDEKFKIWSNAPDNPQNN